MAKNDYETSDEYGAPINLFRFEYGGSSPFFYTDHEDDVLYDDGDGAETYLAQPIELSKIESGGDLSKGQVDMVLPKNTLVAELFRIYPPTTPVVCTIRQGHVVSGDDPVGYSTGEIFPVAWTGKIVDTERKPNGTIKLVGQSAAHAATRPGLRRHYQRPCPHVLFSTACGASEAAASTAAVVSTVGVGSANQIVLTTGWIPGGETFADYQRGKITWIGAGGALESRTILRMDDDDTLYTNGPIRDLVAAQAVTMILKCGRTVDDCRLLHGNIVNYGGQPYVPGSNPIGTNNHTA